jgi:hypothetical protein
MAPRWSVPTRPADSPMTMDDVLASPAQVDLSNPKLAVGGPSIHATAGRGASADRRVPAQATSLASPTTGWISGRVRPIGVQPDQLQVAIRTEPGD